MEVSAIRFGLIEAGSIVAANAYIARHEARLVRENAATKAEARHPGKPPSSYAAERISASRIASHAA